MLAFDVKRGKEGGAGQATIKIPVLASCSKNFPLNCAKSNRIISQAAAFYPGADRLNTHGFLNALACLFLLSTGDDQSVPRVKEYFSQFLADDARVVVHWRYAPVCAEGRLWREDEKTTRGFESPVYERSGRAYELTKQRAGADGTLKLTLAASEESPVFNPVLVVKNWSPESLTLTLNGRTVARGSGFRVGARHTLEGEEANIWIRHQSSGPVTITPTAE